MTSTPSPHLHPHTHDDRRPDSKPHGVQIPVVAFADWQPWLTVRGTR